MEGGDYYRLLGDGYYHISAEAPGFYPSGFCVRIQNHINVAETIEELRPAPQLNFTLTPDTEDRPNDEREMQSCEMLWNEVQFEVRKMKQYFDIVTTHFSMSLSMSVFTLLIFKHLSSK